MKAVKAAVWDLPTRLFHWALVALIGFSWWAAKNDQLEWHMWSGFAILTVLLFRLLWGIFGSSTARFSNFVRGPAAVLGYLRDAKGWRTVGHTPLGALSVVALLGLLGLQIATGLVNSDDDGLVEGPLAPLLGETASDAAHDLHDVLFDGLLIVIGIHVAAIVFYRLVLGKKLLGPMISGRAALDPGTEPMRPGRGWVALLCLVAALAFTRWIVAGAPPLGT
ncbi:cytochrome b/b6 domain-containing protein [Sphingomonas sp.]|uniref:cytochrome b/b6 domain-containing protein n=1 Tax=Sphingomonas sp. TaxID=28214 RepID=UPI00286DB3EF|nr:cytochrome b/b6 domain-containing protein [Sphingomonas sp.]